MIPEISAFYDLRDRALVIVGAGAGQLVEYARPARRVVAIDRDLHGTPASGRMKRAR